MGKEQKALGTLFYTYKVGIFDDYRIDMLREKFGNDGWAFYSYMIDQIFKTNNYEFDFTIENQNSIVNYLSKKICITAEQYLEILKYCLDMGLFDKDEYEERKVLTSEEVRRQEERINENREYERKRKQDYRQKNKNVPKCPEMSRSVPETKNECPEVSQICPNDVPTMSHDVPRCPDYTILYNTKQNNTKQHHHLPPDKIGDMRKISFDEAVENLRSKTELSGLKLFNELVECGVSNEKSLEYVEKLPAEYLEWKLKEFMEKFKKGEIKNYSSFLTAVFDKTSTAEARFQIAHKPLSPEEQKRKMDLESQKKEVEKQERIDKLRHETEEIYQNHTEKDLNEFWEFVSTTNKRIFLWLKVEGLQNEEVELHFRVFLKRKYK